jgi:diadenosine tetraphosphatase ApaH/serine/threonine PP2A family protein phosphatase
LPIVARPEPGLAVCHAAPADLERRIGSALEAERLVAQFPGASLVVGGHTHFATQYGRFLNPGSVGQSRDGVQAARYARYDSESGAITFHSVAYDSTPTLAKLRERHLEPKVCYLPHPSRWDRLRTRVARHTTRALPPLTR